MKRKIAIRATVGSLVICGVIIGGVVIGTREDREEPEESVTEATTVVESETVTESELESESYFGLTEAEVECVIACLREWRYSCSGVDDFKDITCLGYGEKYDEEAGSIVVNYDVIMYGVVLKDRSYSGVVSVDTDELARCGVDVAERGSCRK